MATGRITKTAVDALAPGEALWDSTLKGFGCRCLPSGTRTYVAQYRAGRGRAAPKRLVTIGRHGSPWTPETARREAKRLLGVVAGGGDPAAEREVERKAGNVAKLAETFLAEHVEAKRKPRTAAEYNRLLALFVLPELGKLKVQDVTQAHVNRLHHRMRATPYQANRTLAVLSKMMNLAERWGFRPAGSNPCRHVERHRERARERFLSPKELHRLGRAVAAGERCGFLTPWSAGAIRLLVFTGARLGEVLGLRWEWVDTDRGVARLPDSKTGAKTIHLPPPALEVLSKLPRVAGNPYVIVGGKSGAHLVNLELPWRRIRKAALLNDVRLHDLRHCFASVLASGGASLPVIGKLLGHSQAATTARYAHLAADPVAAAAASAASAIAAAMAGRPAAEVVNIGALKR